MGLEADDGRPETSPPLRRGVQTADRAVVRERQAIPGDQGRVRHRAIDPAALVQASATAAPPGPWTTARPSRTSRSDRGGTTGGWRWRWTFQNKRRRYSHEGRRDAGRRDEAREPAGPRVRRLRPAHASSERSYLCPRRRSLGVRVSAGRSGEQGHRRPFRWAARDAGLVLAAFATLDFPLRDVQVFHTGRGGEFDDTRIDELLDVFDIKGSLSRKATHTTMPWQNR